MKTMKKNNIIVLALVLVCSLQAQAQKDSTYIERGITIEREYTPTIQSAGKIDVRPESIEIKHESADIQYSDYSNTVFSTDFNFNQLGYAQTNFTHAKPLRGFLRGAFGHVNTQADFAYRLTERKDIILDISANHLAQWGLKTVSDTRVGFDFSKLFTNTNLYFAVNANNIYFTRYGRYFNYDNLANMKGSFSIKGYSELATDDKDSQWEIFTRIGVRSLPGKDIKYKVQTGYEAFIMKQGYVEHIVNSEAFFEWQRNGHHIGLDALVQNHLYQADMRGFQWSNNNIAIGDTVKSDYHAIKAEPYYQYDGKRFSIHAGVNLDFCTGKDKLFLPSPNVTFEAKLTEDWMALYGGAVGDWQTSSVRDHFRIMRYVHAENEIATHRNRTYLPVDGFLGLKMRPHPDLRIDIYAHYILTKYDVFLLPDKNGFFNLTGADHDCWKIGARLYYHYQDIVSIDLNGYYNVRKMKSDLPFFDADIYSLGLKKGSIIDREPWAINLRIDAKINRKISLYSANYFRGGNYALAPIATALAHDKLSNFNVVHFKPIIDLNLGVQYNFNRWLSAYFQLNNYLHRKHDLYYGYQSQGINYIAGISWTF